MDWGGAGAILTGTINVFDDPAFVNPDMGDSVDPILLGLDCQIQAKTGDLAIPSERSRIY